MMSAYNRPGRTPRLGVDVPLLKWGFSTRGFFENLREPVGYHRATLESVAQSAALWLCAAVVGGVFGWGAASQVIGFATHMGTLALTAAVGVSVVTLYWYAEVNSPPSVSVKVLVATGLGFEAGALSLLGMADGAGVVLLASVVGTACTTAAMIVLYRLGLVHSRHSFLHNTVFSVVAALVGHTVFVGAMFAAGQNLLGAGSLLNLFFIALVGYSLVGVLMEIDRAVMDGTSHADADLLGWVLACSLLLILAEFVREARRLVPRTYL
jgi:hypothetical protein